MLLSHCVTFFVGWQMLCHVVWHHFTIARGHWNLPWLVLLPFFVVLGWCYCTIYIHTHWSCHKDHQETSRRRPRPKQEDQHDSKSHHKSAGILPKKYIFFIPRQVLWVDRGGCNGFSNKPPGCKSIYGGIWKTGHQHLYNTTGPMEEICWWHLHNHQKEQQR